MIMGDKNIKSQKEKVQRKLKYKPLFDVIIEFDKEIRNQWTIHKNVEELMEKLLSKQKYAIEIRKFDIESGEVETRTEIVESEE